MCARDRAIGGAIIDGGIYAAIAGVVESIERLQTGPEK